MDSEPKAPRRRFGGIVIVALIGLVWLGQGVGIIGGSFMSGDPMWAVIGGVLVLGALVMAWRSR